MRKYVTVKQSLRMLYEVSLDVMFSTNYPLPHVYWMSERSIFIVIFNRNLIFYLHRFRHIILGIKYSIVYR